MGRVAPAARPIVCETTRRLTFRVRRRHRVLAGGVVRTGDVLDEVVTEIGRTVDVDYLDPINLIMVLVQDKVDSPSPRRAEGPYPRGRVNATLTYPRLTSSALPRLHHKKQNDVAPTVDVKNILRSTKSRDSSLTS